MERAAGGAAIPVRVSGDREAEQLARDGPATAVSGVAVERVAGRPKAGSSHVKGNEPAYPPWPHSVCLPEGLAGGCAPSDPGVSGPPRERTASRCSTPRIPSRGPPASVAPLWPTTRPT